jgi:hypothetical protein
VSDGLVLEDSRFANNWLEVTAKVWSAQVTFDEWVMSKPNAKETSQRPEGDDKTTLGGFEGCLGFELGIAGHET